MYIGRLQNLGDFDPCLLVMLLLLFFPGQILGPPHGRHMCIVPRQQVRFSRALSAQAGQRQGALAGEREGRGRLRIMRLSGSARHLSQAQWLCMARLT